MHCLTWNIFFKILFLHDDPIMCVFSCVKLKPPLNECHIGNHVLAIIIPPRAVSSDTVSLEVEQWEWGRACQLMTLRIMRPQYSCNVTHVEVTCGINIVACWCPLFDWTYELLVGENLSGTFLGDISPKNQK